jgi:hypothetical protein
LNPRAATFSDTARLVCSAAPRGNSAEISTVTVTCAFGADARSAMISSGSHPGELGGGALEVGPGIGAPGGAPARRPQWAARQGRTEPRASASGPCPRA